MPPGLFYLGQKEGKLRLAMYVRTGENWIDCVVRLLAFPSVGSRFELRPLVKAIGGISGPCKIVYDHWYKNR